MATRFMNSYLRIFVGVILSGFIFIGCTTRNIREEEKDLLVTVEELENYGLNINHPAEGESYILKTNFDGSTEIEYEYDSKKDSNNDDNLWLKSEAEISNTPDEAIISFKDRINAYKLGLAIGSSDIEIVEDPELFDLGDESYGAYLAAGERNLGNLLVIRKGNTVFSLLLTGKYIDNPQLLHELMIPKLEKTGD